MKLPVSPAPSALTEKEQRFAGCVRKGRGCPEGNLNNGILFLYINKRSEKPQI